MSFLPENYEPPATSGQYTKFKPGETKIRILSDAIVGWVGWTPDNKPVRATSNKSTELGPCRDIREFWAMIVYNLTAGEIQIWEVTQKGIKDAINGLYKNEEWGDPKEYTLTVNRTGQGRDDTKYTVMPDPKKPVPDDIIHQFNEAKIDLNALFEGGDPFAAGAEAEEVIPF